MLETDTETQNGGRIVLLEVEGEQRFTGGAHDLALESTVFSQPLESMLLSSMRWVTEHAFEGGELEGTGIHESPFRPNSWRTASIGEIPTP